MNHGLHWIDFVILVFYAAGMIALGWYYSRRRQTTDEYFSGGGRMNPLLIGVSMYATLFSTISYLTVPGEVLKHGPIVFLMPLASIPFYFCIVGFWIVPKYMQHRATSAYALLETQLGIWARTTGAMMFILLRLMWMSTLIYFGAKAMLVMFGLSNAWLPAVTMATGGIAVFYASIGGLRAVVITDSIQFLLLFCGACIVIGMVTYDDGGIGWIPTRWNESWDEQPFFSLSPTVRASAVSSVLYGICWWVFTAGSDQTAIQRFMATEKRSVRAAFVPRQFHRRRCRDHRLSAGRLRAVSLLPNRCVTTAGGKIDRGGCRRVVSLFHFEPFTDRVVGSGNVRPVRRGHVEH